MITCFRIFFLLLFAVNFSWAQTPSYLSAKAQKGDGVTRFLARYQIDHHACNISEFYKINKLKAKAPLLADKSYLLPILQYTYNGTSIRSSVGIEDISVAKQIERYNDFMYQVGLRSNDFRAKNAVLYVPHHTLHCPTPPETFIPTKRTFPIFGPAFQNTPLQDKKLAGSIYYLISGHGGPDTGARGECDGELITEDEYAYDITLRLARNLLSHGAMVYMIVRDTVDGIREDRLLKCTTSEVCYPNSVIPVDQKERLTQRTDIINELYKKNKNLGADYQCVVEIHIDSRSESKRLDVFFYHRSDDRLGRALAKDLQETLAEKYAEHRASGEYSGSVTERDLHTLRESKPISVFIELGNIQNPNDQQRFILPNNRQALANWLAEGLMRNY